MKKVAAEFKTNLSCCVLFPCFVLLNRGRRGAGDVNPILPLEFRIFSWKVGVKTNYEFPLSHRPLFLGKWCLWPNIFLQQRPTVSCYHLFQWMSLEFWAAVAQRALKCLVLRYPVCFKLNAEPWKEVVRLPDCLVQALWSTDWLSLMVQ